MKHQWPAIHCAWCGRTRRDARGVLCVSRERPAADSADPMYEVWAVVYSNYDPPEVGAIYTSEAAAQADADSRGDPWEVLPWHVRREYERPISRDAADRMGRAIG